jgi:hypothetical protein
MYTTSQQVQKVVIYVESESNTDTNLSPHITIHVYFEVSAIIAETFICLVCVCVGGGG